MISEHATSFAGKPVNDYLPGQVLDFASTAYRIRSNIVRQVSELRAPGVWRYLADLVNRASHRTVPAGPLLDTFLQEPNVEEVTAIVIGIWEEYGASDTELSRIIELLCSAKERLPKLEAIFIGDIVVEECEISWINQTDCSTLLQAYPGLKHLRVRGSQGLSLGRLQHRNLQTLILESGGLPRLVVGEVAEADLPNLEWLELWLGTDMYGGDTKIDDLTPLFTAGRFPKLRRLGLRDSEIADRIAQALQGAGVLDQIDTLDLSLGTLSDEGGQALLDNPAVAKLKTLDLHRHYLSDSMMDKLSKLGPDVNVSDQQEAEDDDRYPAVTE